MKLLLVEDEDALAIGLVDVLRVKGYEVERAANFEGGLRQALQGEHDLILLDAMLGERSGFDILRQLRQTKNTPVIMLTARSTEMDRVLGFELGVDDYVTKPFSLLELLGRIAAVLRRTALPKGSLRFGTVVVDLERFQVNNGEALPAKAFHLLKALASKDGQVVSRDQLLDEVWGPEEAITLRTLNNLVVRIRQVIEEDPEEPRHLKTVHGVGYRLQM